MGFLLLGFLGFALLANFHSYVRLLNQGGQLSLLDEVFTAQRDCLFGLLVESIRSKSEYLNGSDLRGCGTYTSSYRAILFSSFFDLSSSSFVSLAWVFCSSVLSSFASLGRYPGGESWSLFILDEVVVMLVFFVYQIVFVENTTALCNERC